MSNLKKHKDKKGNSMPHLYQDAETGVFWAVIRVGKKIRKKSLQTNGYIEALSFLPAALVELGKEETEEEKNAAPNKLLKDYWAALRKEKLADDISASTMVRVDSIWRNNIDPYLGNWTPDKVKPDMMPDFVEWHRKKHPGRQLVNVYKYLGNLFRYMVRVGALLPVQVPVIKVPKSEKKHHDKKKGRIITDPEREALLRSGPPQIQLMCGLADILGNRKMEIGALLKERIVSEDGRYFIHLTEDDTKTGLPRILAVPSHVEGMLERQVDESGTSPYLFPARNGKHLPSQMIDRMWVEAKTEAKIKGRLKFHDWRHTRATKMAAQNVNPIIACTILGMTLKVYQERYVKLSGKDLLKVIDEIQKAESKP